MSMLESGRWKQSENILISSIISGAFSALLVNPLDVLKIRTQVEQICKCLECSFLEGVQKTATAQDNIT
jgi:hypothetical protein